MTSTRHLCAAHLGTVETAFDIRCHRQLRGPYTGGGQLMRLVLPELIDEHAELIAAHPNEVVGLAPELERVVPTAPQTLTNTSAGKERTRFYGVGRTFRLAQGVAEMLTAWARLCHPDGVRIVFRQVDEADYTDRELLSILLRYCDPSTIQLVIEAGENDDLLGQALAERAERIAAQQPEPAAGSDDLAQLFIDSDGTLPEYEAAYLSLPAAERARRHTARADYLTETAEPGAELGAIPYHREHGTDPADMVIDAFTKAVELCFARGYYHVVFELAPRGLAQFGDDRDQRYWSLANKYGASLSYLRPQESAAHFHRMRAESIDPVIHLNISYMLAMLYTRHLPKAEHDEDVALGWIDTAIAIADQWQDPELRPFYRAFMRNARALVEVHRGNLKGALALVDDGIAITDADLDPDQHRLHRSVLLFNRAQVYVGLGQLEPALRDLDEVINRDPEYGDYYFERAGVRRAAGLTQLALADYAEAIRLSPPFREAHFNRADLLREIGDDDAALADLDYGLMLDPDHVDGLINRVDILLERGAYQQAQADISHGLGLDPTNAHLLTANGSLLAELGDTEGGRRSFSDAIAADATFVPAWTNRAVLAYVSGRPADAVADLSEALGIEDDPVLRMNRAIALQDLGEHQRALIDLDIAVDELGQQEPELLYRRGLSRLSLGDVAGAQHDWTDHLNAYSPDSPSPFVEDIDQAVAIDPRLGEAPALRAAIDCAAVALPVAASS